MYSLETGPGLVGDEGENGNADRIWPIPMLIAGNANYNNPNQVEPCERRYVPDLCSATIARVARIERERKPSSARLPRMSLALQAGAGARRGGRQGERAAVAGGAPSTGRGGQYPSAVERARERASA